jgi:hypothetical protein
MNSIVNSWHFRIWCTITCAKWNDRNPSVPVTRVRHDNSTSNLVCHVCDYDETAPPGSGSIAAFTQGSTYIPHKLQMKIALWIACHHQPFSIIEDPELIDILTDLNSKVVTPSQYTVSCDVKEIFQMSQSKVFLILKVCILFVVSGIGF